MLTLAREKVTVEGENSVQEIVMIQS